MRAQWSRLIIVAAAAALALWLTLLGVVIHQQAERSLLIAAIWRHAGYAAVVALPLLLYAVWRLRGGAPEGRLGLAANWTGRICALVIIMLVVTGPLVVWTHGSPLKIFDWFAIPNPIGKAPAIHAPLEVLHGVLGKALIPALAADLLFSVALRRSG